MLGNRGTMPTSPIFLSLSRAKKYEIRACMFCPYRLDSAWTPFLVLMLS
jgi:hypothetical protein